MSDLMQLTGRVGAAASTVRDYAGGDANVALLALLDALDALYREELVDVQPEGLLALQAQVRQLQALRGVAGGAVQMTGRI